MQREGYNGGEIRVITWARVFIVGHPHGGNALPYQEGTS